MTFDAAKLAKKISESLGGYMSPKAAEPRIAAVLASQLPERLYTQAELEESLQIVVDRTLQNVREGRITP
jgi:hypothetical protein